MVLHKAETLEQTVSLSQTADCYTEHARFPAAVLFYPPHQHKHVTCPVHQLVEQATSRALVRLNAGVVLFTDVSSCPIRAACAQVCLIHSDKLQLHTELQSKVSLRLWWHLLMIFERDFTDKNHIAETFTGSADLRVACLVVFSTWLSTTADDRVGT